MRPFLIVLAVALGVCVGGAALPVDGGVTAEASALSMAAQQPPSGQAQIDVNVNRGGGAWWTNPVWIAVGVVALVLLILVIAMATRGGGTTVIKE